MLQIELACIFCIFPPATIPAPDGEANLEGVGGQFFIHLQSNAESATAINNLRNVSFERSDPLAPSVEVPNSSFVFIEPSTSSPTAANPEQSGSILEWLQGTDFHLLLLRICD